MDRRIMISAEDMLNHLSHSGAPSFCFNMYTLWLSWLIDLVVIFCSAQRLQPLNRQRFDKHLCHKPMGEEAVYPCG